MTDTSGETKIYIGEPIKDIPTIPILDNHFGIPHKTGNRLFRKIFDQVSFSFIKLVTDPVQADLFLIPHDYFRINTRKDYLEQFEKLADKFSKKIVVIVYGDTDENIQLKNSVVLRTSQYRYKKSPNEVMMPPYVEDFLLKNGEYQAPKLRGKSDKPTIGFCGWADFPDLSGKLKFFIKIWISNFKKYIFRDKHAEVRKQGIFFRKKAMKILLRNSQIKTNFIIRRSYSGHRHTIELPHEEARGQYIKNIEDSDFVLCVKGDGNWSYRFYETLALGRLPVLIDTDCTLPMENIIPYEKFIIRIPYKDVSSLPSRIAEFYSSLSDEEFRKRQLMARDAFRQYLCINVFLANMFSTITREQKIS